MDKDKMISNAATVKSISNKDLKTTLVSIDNHLATVRVNGDDLMTIASIRATLNELYHKIGE